MDNLPGRDTQTIVKHEILKDYLDAWAGIITNGLRNPYVRFITRAPGSTFVVRFVYIDCFAFKGRYADSQDRRGWVEGSPLIGVQALDKAKAFAKKEVGFTLETYTILFEEDEDNFCGLLESFSAAGLADRVRRTTDFHSLNCGEIAVVCGDYRNNIEALLAFTERDHTWAFYLLDPYGPKGLEYNIVGRIVSPPRHDVMINFPYQDLHKKTGSVRKQTPEHQSHVHYYDLLYGENSWQALVEIYDYAADRLEEELVRFYAERLHSQDLELAVKTIPLLFPDRNRTIFYLFLTTHDPTGALKMNEILYGAKQNEYEYRVQWKTDQETKLTRQLSGGLVQQTLFDLPEQKTEPVLPPRFRIEDVAADIYSCCKGQTKKYRDVMRNVVDSPYFPDEVQKAIKWLKREKRVEFSDSRLLNETLITFR